MTQSEAETARHAHASPASAITIELRGIRKSFGETRALQGLDLLARSGEILGIAGPNGAGKSTLIRILAGEEERDDGEILVDGLPWFPGDPEDRVAVVHQEPQLWPNLTVAQNMMVGRERSSVLFPRLPKRDRQILTQLEVQAYIDRALADCPLAVRQRIEIARALAQDGRFFLFDEPNSALTEDESNRLFRSMHDLAARGRVVMLVSHRLAEMVAHCQRVVIIRDGRVTAALSGRSLTEASIARELVLGYQAVGAAERSSNTVGGDAEASPVSTPATSQAPILLMEHWSAADGAFVDVSLRVRRAEVVALVGVEGSGARDIVASAARFVEATGSITVDSAEGPRAASERTVYLPADRREMLFANLSVGANLVMRLGVPQIAVAPGFLRPWRLRGTAEALVSRFRVRTQSAQAPLTSLSGGNQQKVAIAAALARRPALLVLEEPTRGVDVGSKAEIYRILRDYARAGHGVLVYCTEVPEVHELADEFVVVDRGRAGKPIRVADLPDITALADAIANYEHTAVAAEDLLLSHASQAAGDHGTSPETAGDEPTA